MAEEKTASEGSGLTMGTVNDIGEFKAVPQTEVKPEDVCTLTLTYEKSVPTLTVSGGTAIPGTINVVDESGASVATYTAGAPIKTRSSAEEDYFSLDNLLAIIPG